jgi:hypothetical protein
VFQQQLSIALLEDLIFQDSPKISYKNLSLWAVKKQQNCVMWWQTTCLWLNEASVPPACKTAMMIKDI